MAQVSVKPAALTDAGLTIRRIDPEQRAALELIKVAVLGQLVHADAHEGAVFLIRDEHGHHTRAKSRPPLGQGDQQVRQ